MNSIIFDNDDNFNGREVDCDSGSGGEVDGGGCEGEVDCGDSGGEVDGACCEGEAHCGDSGGEVNGGGRGSENDVGGCGGEVDGGGSGSEIDSCSFDSYLLSWRTKEYKLSINLNF